MNIEEERKRFEEALARECGCHWTDVLDGRDGDSYEGEWAFAWRMWLVRAEMANA